MEIPYISLHDFAAINDSMRTRVRHFDPNFWQWILLHVVPEYDTLYSICDFDLCFWLSKFVHETKKKDASEYPPNTRYQIFAGLQRALRENGLPELDIFRNPRYKLFQDSIDLRMKTLTRPGLGVNVNQAKPISA